MTEQYKPIRTAEDITEPLIDVIETVFEGWYADEPRIDWLAFLERVEIMGHVDFGSSMDSPAIKAVKKIVKDLRNN
jgi:hypothetical protein